MAKREALRELQSRLAERLQQARTEVRSVSWLAVESGGLGLLFPLPTAGEIFPVGTLLPVPHTQPWFMGVANLRGGLHGVVDFAAFLGLRAPIAREAVREQAQLLALSARFGASCALLVDRLAGLRSAEQLQPEPADETPRPVFAGGRWRDETGRVWQEIDLAALARHDQFLAISA
ncbi:chemotaxis protein CheW [beta proteobacterium AAP121]|nr:chemotaxis protein CheW [beta proteobacterium AAP65]KPF94950.1 chemotaxis protein CheW [beta proteobacterium AAP121]